MPEERGLFRVLGIYSANILELIAPIVFSAFVNNIKYKLPGNIEDINNN